LALFPLFLFLPDFFILDIMLFSPCISTRALAQLCRRLSIAVGAGIDARTMWAKETERTRGCVRDRLAAVSRAVSKGESLHDALLFTGDFFPVLFREMADVGEQTGKLDAIFAQLADYYEERLKLRRQFLAVITWPMFELTAAVAAVGFLIWIMGVIQEMNRNQGGFDPLGIGLYGNRGLAIYLGFVFGVVAIAWLTIRAIARGLAWTRPIQYALMRIPVLGKALETLALARLAWSLSATLHSGMELRRALRLSLASTNNAKFTDKIQTIDDEIEQGNSIYDAFSEAGCFRNDFLDAVAVGEQSGRLEEAMDGLSRQYQEQAQYAFKTLNTVAAFLVWMLIAAVIITMIFRLAFSYFGVLNQFSK
jgi:type II secretory pathway component PulF